MIASEFKVGVRVVLRKHNRWHRTNPSKCATNHGIVGEIDGHRAKVYFDDGTEYVNIHIFDDSHYWDVEGEQKEGT